MSDYGIIVTLPGHDYKTATPEQCAVHSKYPSPKISTLEQSHAGYVSILFSNTIPANTTRRIYTVAHNLGYTPMAWCLYYDPTSPGSDYTEYGILPYYSASFVKISCITDDTNLYLDLNTPFATDSSGLNGSTIYFRWYIFAEEAAS